MIASTRPSVLAKGLDSGFGLMAFEACTTLEVIAQHKDLRDQLAMTTGETWRDYKPLYQAAQARRGKPEANAGTLIHKAAELLALDQDVSAIPKDVLADANAALDAIYALGLEVEGAEVRLANLTGLAEPIAGTCDLVVSDEHSALHIVDIKSTGEHGNAGFRALAWAVQLACYAHSAPYKGGEWQRDSYGRPLVDPDLIGEPWPSMDRTEGLVVEVKRGAAEVQCHVVNLTAGWEFARLACAVRAARKAACIETLTT